MAAHKITQQHASPFAPGTVVRDRGRWWRVDAGQRDSLPGMAAPSMPLPPKAAGSGNWDTLCPARACGPARWSHPPPATGQPPSGPCCMRVSG